LVELGFAVIGNKGRALLIRANVPFKYRFHLFREAFKTATDLDGLIIIELNGKRATRYEHFYGVNPPWAKFLKNWGEAGTVKMKTATTPKLADCGVQCMMVGYAEQHEAEVYRMWNPLSRKVHITSDIIWLNQMLFFTKKVDEKGTLPDGIEAKVDTSIHEDGKSTHDDVSDEELDGSGNDVGDEDGAEDDIDTDIEELDGSGNDVGDEDGAEDDIDTEIENIDKACEANTDDGDEDAGRWTTASTGHQTRAPERYIQEISASAVDKMICEQNYYKLLNNEEDKDEDEDNGHEIACVGAGIGGGFSNTNELHVMKYKQATKTKDKDKWEESVFQEHERMVKRSIWLAVPKKKVPEKAKTYHQHGP
jgi:hypothetical protein